MVADNAMGRTRQVEQDLIISRALVALFSDEFLKAELGGTALNNLHFPKPLRYSEDIDLVYHGRPDRAGVDRVREVLNPWFGEPQFVQNEIAPKLKYSVEAEDKSNPAPIRLRIEINTRERTAYDTPQSLPFKVENTWFTGTADISTFSNEELLSTKLRALLQCHKGRDLIDIAHALDIFEGFDASTTVEVLGKYLAAGGISISRAEAEKRMFTKLNNPNFMADVRPLLSADEAEDFDDDAAKAAFVKVFSKIIRLMPGEAWSKTEKMIEQSGLIDQFE
ncbi:MULTISPECIES: nucleotidyl transferase AbiEii/AbiGii toxin family protein [unclassified Bradyrhizobium]|uniref:nucleotidyl transferase AbiEii/AbiGii toxin family protein n=1 Tax=unclassified Bradyrhizobium TaxID=2631580 RepID=UPI0020BFF72D|nr:MULTISPECIES: nucleotidyl transferase AbiEii/AbiGii toxin family protein [unclassified Bradyrhizobium]